MKKEYGIIEYFILYKQFLKDRDLPIRGEKHLIEFLRARYGDKIKGRKLEEITEQEKYNIAKKESFRIINELNLNPQRERLLEGILLVKENPDDFSLYNKVLEAIEKGPYDLLLEFSRVTSTNGKEPEQLKFCF
ncbi:MAG: hypothetical protein QW404_01875 [Candidatus Nanoarchaeia archaeon]